MKNSENNTDILILDDQEPGLDFFEVIADLCVRQTKDDYGIDLQAEFSELDNAEFAWCEMCEEDIHEYDQVWRNEIPYCPNCGSELEI